MTKIICHICRINIEQATPRFSVAWQNVDESGSFAYFNDKDRAIEYCSMLTELKDIEPICVWDLVAGKQIHWDQ